MNDPKLPTDKPDNGAKDKNQQPDANQQRPSTSRPSLRSKERQTDDPSEAPESGTRDRPDEA